MAWHVGSLGISRDSIQVYFQDSSMRCSYLHSLWAEAIKSRFTAHMWYDIVRPKVTPTPSCIVYIAVL